MTDNQNVATQDPAQAKADPLDILEKLLNDAKNKGVAGPASNQAGSTSDQTMADLASLGGAGGVFGGDGAGGIPPMSGLGFGQPSELELKKQEELEAQKEEEKRLAEEERQRQVEAQMAEDRLRIKQQLEEMKQIKDMPAYQARVKQDREKSEQKQKSSDNDGFQIRQLQHIKVYE